MHTPNISGLGSTQWRQLTKLFYGILLVAGFAFTAACNGTSGSGDDSAATGPGSLMIALADAQGDFLSYDVDIVSLTLTRADGTVVETLPVNTRVDFAQYTQLTEFLTAATVPSGKYVKASITLDYQAASIVVEDATGNPVTVNSILDGMGNPAGLMEMSVGLSNANALVIAPGIPAHLLLDFDLAATNVVTFDAGGLPSVTVTPILIAEVNRDNSRLHRVRGALKEVFVDRSGFLMAVRPFRHLIADPEDRFGLLPVKTHERTIFKVDGVRYQGAAGLEAMSVVPARTRLIVLGDFKLNPRRFSARAVYVGTSMVGDGLDMVTGSVTKRTGDVLTVYGASFAQGGTGLTRRSIVEVLLANTTIVQKQLSDENFTINDISVGQRLTVFGALTGETASALTMDATDGQAHMWLSGVGGLRVGAAGTPLVLNLISINGRPVSLYDFSGTGVDMTSDADPTNYQVDTGVLDVSAIDVNAPVRVRGFVTPFGSADPDFTAITVIETPAL